MHEDHPSLPSGNFLKTCAVSQYSIPAPFQCAFHHKDINSPPPFSLAVQPVLPGSAPKPTIDITTMATYPHTQHIHAITNIEDISGTRTMHDLAISTIHVSPCATSHIHSSPTIIVLYANAITFAATQVKLMS
ncbi:hypothetical protein OG21DRAFT_1492288 [Imleria badia]|nr:hypothetical protein OG21DRAFT_1492288 [Imleria badia]